MLKIGNDFIFEDDWNGRCSSLMYFVGDEDEPASWSFDAGFAEGDYNGEEMAIGFNDEKLIEILSNINSDIVVVKLLDPTRAGIFVPDSQPEGEDVLMLLMPMML